MTEPTDKQLDNVRCPYVEMGMLTFLEIAASHARCLHTHAADGFWPIYEERLRRAGLDVARLPLLMTNFILNRTMADDALSELGLKMARHHHALDRTLPHAVAPFEECYAYFNKHRAKLARA